INAAYAIRIGEKTGSLAPGKQADLLILDAHSYVHIPYEFGRNLVETVIKKGKIVWSTEDPA
ncbi:MAG: imidazolonepropionase, partial [Candidatus Hydrothermota bacterium]